MRKCWRHSLTHTGLIQGRQCISFCCSEAQPLPIPPPPDFVWFLIPRAVSPSRPGWRQWSLGQQRVHSEHLGEISGETSCSVSAGDCGRAHACPSRVFNRTHIRSLPWKPLAVPKCPFSLCWPVYRACWSPFRDSQLCGRP